MALAPGQRRSWLIAPAPDWTHWDVAAERVHRLTRAVLERHGRPRDATKRQVAAELAVARHRASHDAWVVQETYVRTRRALGDSVRARGESPRP